jgi:hypothetical protein
MRQDFWRRFDVLAREPLHVKRALPASQFAAADVLGTLSALHEDAAGAAATVRAYVKGAQSHELEDRVIHAPPRPGESLERWSRRMFGRRRFGVVINYAERWNDELTRKVALFLAPLYRASGSPLAHAIEINIFFGDYGYTPFGAHRDDAVTSVVHLHVGPASKTMTTWSPRRYRSITGGGRPCFAPGSIVRGGRSFRVDAGDIFVLPAGCYHVGWTPRFSAGIAVAITPQKPEAALQKAIVTYGSELAQAASRSRASLTTSAWLQSILARFRARQASLLGFHALPLPRRPRRLNNCVVALAAPFPIGSAAARDGRGWLYVRGTEIGLRTNRAIERIVRQLNSGAPLPAGDLIRQMTSELSESAAARVLELLFQYRGIDVVQ